MTREICQKVCCTFRVFALLIFIKPVSLFIFLVSFVILGVVSSLVASLRKKILDMRLFCLKNWKKKRCFDGKWEMGDEIDPCFSFFRLLLFFFLSFWLQISFTFILSDYVGFPSLTLPLKAEINYKGKPMQTADSADIGKINCWHIKISAVHLPHNKH